MSDTWRCAVCGKVKDLHGDHLRNKTEVRSDCWPCGIKRTFIRQGDVNLLSSVIEEPKSTSPDERSRERTLEEKNTINNTANTSINVTNSNNNDNKPRNDTNTFFTKTNKKSQSIIKTTHIAELNNLPHFPLRTCNVQTQSPSWPQCNSPFIVQTTTGTSPPFTFKAAPMFTIATPPEKVINETGNTAITSNSQNDKHSGNSPKSEESSSHSISERQSNVEERPHLTHDSVVIAKEAIAVNACNSKVNDEVWRCSVCGKVKDLHGDHLRNKTEVRSDCWPCGIKRTFMLQSPVQHARWGNQNTVKQGESNLSSSINARKQFCNSSSDNTNANDDDIDNSNNNNNNNGQLQEKHKDKERPPTKVAEIPEQQQLQEQRQYLQECQEIASKLHSGGEYTAHAFTHPIIPLEENNDAFLLRTHQLSTLTLPQSTSANINNQEFTRSLLTHLHTMSPSWPPRRCVWNDAAHTLYVLLTELEIKNNYNTRCSKDSERSCLNNVYESNHNTRQNQTHASRASSRNIDENIDEAELLGRYAAHLFIIEQMIAQFSPFQRVTRWFCDSELSFAACCCYASQICPKVCDCVSEVKHNRVNNTSEITEFTQHFNNADNESEVKLCSCSCHESCCCHCSIFGPMPDPTRERTTYGNIIANAALHHFPWNSESEKSSSSHAHVCVFPTIVSEEQRIAAAQEFYRRTSWLSLPIYMNGMAIHLKESVHVNATCNGSIEVCDRSMKHLLKEQQDKPRQQEYCQDGSKSSKCIINEVSVVLVASTMKLEELAQAATWTLPPTP